MGPLSDLLCWISRVTERSDGGQKWPTLAVWWFLFGGGTIATSAFTTVSSCHISPSPCYVSPLSSPFFLFKIQLSLTEGNDSAHSYTIQTKILGQTSQ